MKRAIALMFIGGLAAAPSEAAPRVEQALIDALLEQMQLTYVCRDVIGGIGDYDAARRSALAATIRSTGEDEGTKTVTALDRQLRGTAKSDIDLSKCIALVREGYYRVRYFRSLVEAKPK